MLLGDWLSLANLVTAVVAILVTALVTLYVSRARSVKRLTVVQYAPTILFESVQNQDRRIEVALNGVVLDQINRQLVSVINTGNVSISDFDLHIRGESGDGAFVPSVSESSVAKYSRSIFDQNIQSNRFVSYNIEYLNPKESFDVEVLYSGQIAELEVQLRKQDVDVRILKRSDSTAALELAIELMNPATLLTKSLTKIVQKMLT